MGGGWGYRRTYLRHAEQYVRARHLSTSAGRWRGVDPLWPQEDAYGYGGGRVTGSVDPSGKCSISKTPFKCMGRSLEAFVIFTSGDGIGLATGNVNGLVGHQCAIDACKGQFPQRGKTLVVNGSLFNYNGPLGPLQNCCGQKSNGIGGAPEVSRGARRVNLQKGFFSPRKIGLNGKCNPFVAANNPKEFRPRVIATVINGSLVSLIVVKKPGINADGMCQCFKSLPGGAKFYALDGGFSTQIWEQQIDGGPILPIYQASISGKKEEVNNWVWFRSAG